MKANQADGWTTKTLSDLATINMGQSPDSKTYNELGIGLPFLQGCGDFGKNHPETNSYCSSPSKQSKVGNILISVRAPVGDMNTSDKEYCIGRGLAAIAGTQIESSYLRYSIEQHITWLKRRGQGSTFEAIGSRDLNDFPVPIPKSSEVRNKITSILTTVDNLIDQTQNLIDKYTAVKHGMMADLFSRGIDLSGTPENNNSYGQLRPSYEEAPELYQETELGWMPKDWDINAIGEFSEVKGGKRLPAGEPFANEVTPYPYLRVTDMVDGWIDDTNLEYVSSEIEAIISRYKIYESDIYVTIAGTLGLFGRIPSHLNGAQLTENAARITSFDTSKYNPDYLCSYLRSDKLIPQLYKAIGVGAGVPKLALYQIEQFKLPVPSFKEQEELVKKIASSTELIAKEKKYLNKLKLKKKGLMQDLLTGKVKV